MPTGRRSRARRRRARHATSGESASASMAGRATRDTMRAGRDGARACRAGSRVGFAGERAALDDEHASVGDGRGICAALDGRDAHTAGAEQRMPRPGGDLEDEARSARSPSIARSIASTPCWGCEPCAARPSYSTRYQAKPRCARVAARSVGSSTTAHGGARLGCGTARRRSHQDSSMPTEPNSSSAAKASTRSPASSAGAADAARPWGGRDRWPCRRRRGRAMRVVDGDRAAARSTRHRADAWHSRGGRARPGPTVSRCPASSSVRPTAGAAPAREDARPSAGSAPTSARRTASAGASPAMTCGEFPLAGAAGG